MYRKKRSDLDCISPATESAVRNSNKVSEILIKFEFSRQIFIDESNKKCYRNASGNNRADTLDQPDKSVHIQGIRAVLLQAIQQKNLCGSRGSSTREEYVA